jgi:tRNA(Ile2)-agmatinylcytidine synthase
LEKRQILHIGIDDTDSPRKGCTTYLAAVLMQKLSKLGVKLLDYPHLIRLNPNVPWKTRGNGALAMKVEFDESIKNRIKEETINLVEEQADLSSKGTNPGIVFIKRDEIPEDIRAFSGKATVSFVTLKEAREIIKKNGGECFGFNNCRGIIGALAAVGSILESDYTYELIAYRTPENYGTKRKVDDASIFSMDQWTQPHTFNNVDYEKKRIIITPRGPDPILFGIRGETPEIVKRAFELIKPLEPIERWLIFRSNQGTDAHLKPATSLKQIEEYSSVIARGQVSQSPKIIPLRHVIFSIKDDTGEVDCAAYEPTGDLRKTARNLMIGDAIEAYGAVRKTSSPSNRLTINLEKINITALAPITQLKNPPCPTCKKRMKSMGRDKGFRCERCRTKTADTTKVAIACDRGVKTGLYITSTRSQRHLTKPLRRYGLEKHDTSEKHMIANWHSP